MAKLFKFQFSNFIWFCSVLKKITIFIHFQKAGATRNKLLDLKKKRKPRVFFWFCRFFLTSVFFSASSFLNYWQIKEPSNLNEGFKWIELFNRFIDQFKANSKRKKCYKLWQINWFVKKTKTNPNNWPIKTK